MRVSIIQSALHWEMPDQNRKMFAEKLQPLRGQSDLVVLPEMFTTGFSMEAARLAESLDGPTLAWMQEQSAALGGAITGSFICAEEGRFYNRLLWVQPDGQFFYYDKKHLFGLAAEHQTYSAGKEKLQINWLGWNICPFICYDLRFPVWIRQEPASVCDLLLFVANWPSTRALHWRSLLVARAIENQCFTIGINITGKDGNGYQYDGDSSIIDFGGALLCQIHKQESACTTELSLEELHKYRKQLPFLNDADPFKLI